MNEPLKLLEDRILELEQKIDYVSKILGINSSAKKTNTTHTAALLPTAPTEIVSAEKPSVAPLKILPILAVICFGLAGIFIVKLAIDSGWLTPVRQWGLLALFGLGLSSFGYFFESIEKSYRSYASAAGIIILFLASYSSFYYFHLASPLMAQVLAGVVAFLCLFFVRFFESEKFTVISIIGTYISPILLGQDYDFIFLSSFFLIWSFAFSQASIYLKSRTLTLLASYMGLGVYAFLHTSTTEQDLLLYIILVQSMQFIIYTGSVYFYSLKNKEPLSKNEAIAYLPILLFFYGTIYYFLFKYNPLIAPWISLGFAGFIFLLYWRAKASIANLESQKMIQWFLSIVLFHSGYMELVPAAGKPWLLPLIILGMYISENREDFKKSSFHFKLLFSIIAAIEFFRLSFNLIVERDTSNVMTSFVTIGLGFFYYFKGGKSFKNREGLFLGLIHLLCILSIYRLAFDYGSLAVSTGWGCYSVAILIFGYVKKNVVVAKSSLIVLAVTCLKALLYDASQAPSTVRIFSLILTGFILYGAGYLFQMISKWDLLKE